MSEVAAVVAWYGPYKDRSSARKAASDDFGAGLYVAFGYQTEPAIGRPRLLYVGVGSPLHTRLTNQHHAIGETKVAKISSIWLGVIESHKKPGRRMKKIEPMMDAVEGAMIALLRPPLNVRRTKFPSQSLAIINRWYDGKDYSTPKLRPSLKWPDIFECAGSGAPAYLCWLDRQRVRRLNRPPAGAGRGG